MNKKKNIINKPWGFEEILEINNYYTVKRLVLLKDHQCSLQYHQKKKETVISIIGNLNIYLDNKLIILNPGEYITIKPGKKHRMKAIGTDCHYVECSTSDLDDVVRIEDDYGRI